VSKLRKNEKGFTAVETVLVLVVIIIICVVGWLIYKNDHRTKTSTTLSSASAFKSYNTDGVSFKYPTTWNVYSFKTGALADLLSVAPVRQTLKSGGQIAANTSNFAQYDDNSGVSIQIISPTHLNSTVTSVGPNYQPLTSGQTNLGSLTVNKGSYVLVGSNATGTAGSPTMITLESCKSDNTCSATISTSNGAYLEVQVSSEGNSSTPTVPVDTSASNYSSIIQIIRSLTF